MNIFSFRYILLFAIAYGCVISATGQQEKLRTDDYISQQEQLKKSLLMRALDSGVILMENNEYARADEKFKEVIANIRSIPSDLCYYFGKNSYFLEKYGQSIDWLNKYIQLKGTNGQFSEDAVFWLRKAEAAYLAEKNKAAQEASALLSKEYEIDCGPSNRVLCPVCKGQHVIIKKGSFGNQYRTCPYCDEHGVLTCEEYNQLLKGQLKPKF